MLPEREQTTSGPQPVKALHHALDVLDVVADAGEPLGVSEIARRTGLSKTAAYKILATFERRRYVVREPGGSRYRLGWRLHELGAVVESRHELVALARPHLTRLRDRCGETVMLGILESHAVSYLERCESQQLVRMVARPGRQSPLHATATGKVLLAFAPTELVATVLAAGLRRFTAHTIVDRAKLRAELLRVRELGYAVCRMEHEPELNSVSVPVRDFSGEVIVALTVAAPAGRLTDAVLEPTLAALTETAGDLEADLGYRHDVRRDQVQ
jgi:IclR family KDG regulon transcriptional repressor